MNKKYHAWLLNQATRTHYAAMEGAENDDEDPFRSAPTVEEIRRRPGQKRIELTQEEMEYWQNRVTELGFGADISFTEAQNG